jgi:hypothetical protein
VDGAPPALALALGGTDVITGALVGTSCGLLYPALRHRLAKSGKAAATVTPTGDGGAVLSLTGRF